jgi:predicted kinase
MSQPRLYVVFGIPFSGKSTLARELVCQRGCRVIDIDALNTARGVGIAGAPITQEDWAISFASARARLVEALAAGESVVYLPGARGSLPPGAGDKRNPCRQATCAL